MSEIVELERRGRIALLTLNRPEKLNAFNYAMNDRLLALLDEIEVDPQIDALIVTGAGNRAFSAGGDIPEFAESIRAGLDHAMQSFVRRGQAMTQRFEAFPKPVVAAVNGLAYGGGCELTEAVHLAIASEDAMFAKPEVVIGIPPTFGGTQRLPRLIGRKRGLELLLTGDTITAARAYELGIVNKVVPKDRVIPEAFSLAERIIRHAPSTVSAILNAVTRGINLTIGEGLAFEAEQFARVAKHPDTIEGLDSWIARRAPVYGRQRQ